MEPVSDYDSLIVAVGSQSSYLRTWLRPEPHYGSYQVGDPGYYLQSWGRLITGMVPTDFNFDHVVACDSCVPHPTAEPAAGVASSLR
jgi:hypothetical protein